MNSKFLKISVFVALLIFFASYLLYKIPLPVAQDLARQIINGKDILAGNFDVITTNIYSYVEATQPFANHHWFYGVMAYCMHYLIGFSGMVIFKTVLFLLTFSLLFKIAIKNTDFWLVSFFSIPTILILLGRGDLRPEAFSYFFIVLFIFLLIKLEENPNSNKIFWLIPIQLIWVNTHLYFPIGIFIVAGFLIEQLILNYKKIKETKIIKKLSYLLLGLSITIFLNPYGLVGIIRSLIVNKNPDFPISSAELGSLASVFKYSPKIDNLSAMLFQYLVIILAASFIIAIAFRWKKKLPLFSNHSLFYLVASGTTIVLGFNIIRSLPLFGLIFLLAICNNLHGIFIELRIWLSGKIAHSTNLIPMTFVVLLILMPLVYLTFFARPFLSPYNYLGIGLTPRAEESANFFIDNGLEGPIFNDTDVGSYLIYYLYPVEKVFSDNRFGDAYSASFFSDIYNPMIKDENKWKEALEKYKFNTIFFYQYDGGDDVRDFLFRRFYDPEWVLVYADTYNVIFVRNTIENKNVIDKFGINLTNMTEKLSPLLNSKDPADYLAAADIYGLFGQIGLANNQYLRFVSEVPTRGKVWMVLGRNELTRSDQENSNPYLAAIFLEKSIANGWVTTESLSYLALAYYRTGQIDRTKEMVKRELEIDPDSTDGQKWLGVLADEELKKNDKQ